MGAIIRLDVRHARAYVAEPETDVRGRVVVVHDAYGLLPHVRALCDDLAARGFVAIAPDLFAGATATSDAAASRLLEHLTAARAAAVLDATLQAYDTLGHRQGPDAVVGFSVGAEFAFGLVARARLQTTVTYYGLPCEDDRAGLGGALLAQWAEHDRWDDEASPRQIATALRARGVDVVSVTYPGTAHGFGNADIAAFDRAAAAQAWRRTVQFLSERLSAA